MDPFCVPHTELPHASKLFTDYLYHYSRVAPFYGGNPKEADSYRKAASAVHFPDARRAALVSALREQNGEHKALDLLAKPGTVAVVTGQQVGLFGGPAYSVYKALTAVKLARQLTGNGIPAVPVFWMATEDHDFAEISHCWSFDAAQNPVFLKTQVEGAGQTPVGGIALENPPLNELRTSLARLPYGDEISTLAELAYSPGRTMGAAFGDLLKNFLPKCLLYLDPLHPSIRTLAAPVLREAFAEEAELRSRLIERSKELEGAGYHAQVLVDARSSLFFLLRDGKRLPLRQTDDGYRVGELSLSAEEIAAHAEQLSPNAILRPVIQDHILPTAAYVGGPAEIAYFAQSQVLYRHLLGRMSIAVPRATFTIIDGRGAKLIDRFGLSLDTFFQGRDALEEKIAAQLIPEELEEAIVDATGSISEHLEQLRSTLELFDPTLATALDKSRAKIIHQLTKIGRKTAREAMRRDDRAEENAAYLYNLVYPRKHPQERLYSILPLLARHGVDFIDRLYEHVHLERPDLVVLTA